MYKITKTYEDFSGNEITRDFYFHIEQHEIAELYMKDDGGVTRYIKALMETKSGSDTISFLKKFMDAAYGVKRLDSNNEMKFYKSPEILADFKASKAYSMIYLELATDAELAIAFIKGIIQGSVEISDSEFDAAYAEAIKMVKAD